MDLCWAVFPETIHVFHLRKFRYISFFIGICSPNFLFQFPFSLPSKIFYFCFFSVKWLFEILGVEVRG
jgi:hypothetical protein